MEKEDVDLSPNEADEDACDRMLAALPIDGENEAEEEKSWMNPTTMFANLWTQKRRRKLHQLWKPHLR